MSGLDNLSELGILVLKNTGLEVTNLNLSSFSELLILEINGAKIENLNLSGNDKLEALTLRGQY